MKASCRLFVGSILGLALAASALPQDKAPSGSVSPRLLVIQREFVKPGKSGTAHEKTESAFVQAMARAKWPTHYIAFQSLSGKPRALFFTIYDSYEAWEKDTQAQEKNAVLSAALDRANETDGTLLDSSDEGVFTYNADFSLRTKTDLSDMRYLEIWAVRVKPGHDREWAELNKLVLPAFEKAVPTAHWGAYEAAYGVPNGTYLFLTARKTAAELDRGPMEDKAFQAEMGEEGMKKVDELFAACVESSESQLFAVSPTMSYPPDEFVKADAAFWAPKQATMSAERKAQPKVASVSAEKKTP